MSIVPPPYGQRVVDVDAVALHRQLARDRDARGPGADDGDLLGARLDVGHDVGDAGGLVPLDEEALHGPDREGPVDVAAAAGALARGGADVRAHRRHRVGLPGQDVALLEPALGREVEVAAAVRADRARLLALDVALQPRGVDRLDEELLVDVEGQGAAEPLCVVWLTVERRGPATRERRPARSIYHRVRWPCSRAARSETLRRAPATRAAGARTGGRAAAAASPTDALAAGDGAPGGRRTARTSNPA